MLIELTEDSYYDTARNIIVSRSYVHHAGLYFIKINCTTTKMKSLKLMNAKFEEVVKCLKQS